MVRLSNSFALKELQKIIEILQLQAWKMYENSRFHEKTGFKTPWFSGNPGMLMKIYNCLKSLESKFDNKIVLFSHLCKKVSTPQ